MVSAELLLVQRIRYDALELPTIYACCLLRLYCRREYFKEDKNIIWIVSRHEKNMSFAPTDIKAKNIN